MATRGANGAVTLTPAEVATLEHLLERWRRGSYQPGTAAGDAVLDLAMELREILEQAR